MLNRHVIYRQQVAYAHHEAEAGRALVLQPDADLGIPHVCHDADLMRRVYDTGRALVERRLQEIQAFFNVDPQVGAGSPTSAEAASNHP